MSIHVEHTDGSGIATVQAGDEAGLQGYLKYATGAVSYKFWLRGFENGGEVFNSSPEAFNKSCDPGLNGSKVLKPGETVVIIHTPSETKFTFFGL